VIYKEHLTLLKRLQLAADLVVLEAAFPVAYALWGPFAAGNFARSWHWLWLPPTAALVWLFFLDANGLYYSYRTVRSRDLAFGIAKSIFQGTFVLSTAIYLLHAATPVSRLLLLLYSLTSFTGLLGGRLLVYATLSRVRQRGWNYNAILVLGTGRAAQDLVRGLRRNAHWGIRVFGYLSHDTVEKGRLIEGAEVLGALEQFEEVLAGNAIDEVAIALPAISADALAELIAICEREGVKARVITDLYRSASSRLVVEELDGLPIVTFAVGPGVGWQMVCKEVIDRVGALVLLLLALPLLLVVAVAVKLDSSGPVLFVQERVGLRKRRFRLYKFRTMVEDAEARRALLEPLNEFPGPVFKMRHDPRVTRVGRWLRRFSIDELPQLWNVLIGEMSFIGPRPPLSAEVAQYENWQRRRLSMKPGISGLWQVVGRGRKLDFSDWVKLDLEYIDNWSLALDLRILLWTVPAVIFGKGAV
jgi:exopolysaccharide biosynthesis polyprenyl glycosylphosphotransferase